MAQGRSTEELHSIHKHVENHLRTIKGMERSYLIRIRNAVQKELKRRKTNE